MTLEQKGLSNNSGCGLSIEKNGISNTTKQNERTPNGRGSRETAVRAASRRGNVDVLEVLLAVTSKCLLAGSRQGDLVCRAVDVRLAVERGHQADVARGQGHAQLAAGR